MAHHVAIGLVLILVGTASFYAWRQRAILRRAADPGTPDSERRFLRRQARRRLLNCVPMAILGAMLAGTFLSGMEQRADQLATDRSALRAAGDDTPMTAEERRFAKFYGWYWIAMLLVLLVIVTIAGIDMMATRRYALTQMRLLREDRRQVIERELARFRHERNGTH